MSKSLYCLSGRLGYASGMDTAAIGMVTEDNDGEIPESSNHNWVVDISHLLSEQLGKQMPMTATYRVKGIHMSLRNVNNTADNDAALAYGGVISWYSPTKHRIDAIQHARAFKRARAQSLDDESDPFHMYTNDAHYKGLRWNWDADGQVDGDSTDDTTVLSGTYFSFDQMFEHYDLATGGRVSDSPYPDSGEGMALWNTRCGLNEVDTLYFNTMYQNRMWDTDGVDAAIHAPSFQTYDWQSDSNHLAVLGGLLNITGVHSSTDMAGFTEDEYYIQLTVMVEGWEEF